MKLKLRYLFIFIALFFIFGCGEPTDLSKCKMLSKTFDYDGEVPVLRLDAPEEPFVEASCEGDAMLAIYSPLDDTVVLKGAPGDFESLRNNYRLRREPSAYTIKLSEAKV